MIEQKAKMSKIVKKKKTEKKQKHEVIKAPITYISLVLLNGPIIIYRTKSIFLTGLVIP